MLRQAGGGGLCTVGVGGLESEGDKKKCGSDFCAWASAFNHFFLGALSTHRPPTTDTTSSVKVCEKYHPFYNVAVSCTQVCIPNCKVEKQQYSSVLGTFCIVGAYPPCSV